MSNQQQLIKRRVTFTPIMLTSKSIRPMDRNKYDQARLEYRTRPHKKQQQESMLRDSSDWVLSRKKNLKAEPIVEKDYIQEEDQNQMELSFRKMVRKMTTAAVVQMHFSDQKEKERENNSRYSKKGMTMEDSSMIRSNLQAIDQDKVLMHGSTTAPRNFQSFTKSMRSKGKIPESQKYAQIPKGFRCDRNSDVQDQWSEYLNTYYLSIRKVKPLLKKESTIKLLSPQKILAVSQIHYKSNTAKTSQANSLARFKSTSSYLDGSNKKNQTPKKQQNLSNLQIFKKIQKDLMGRRALNHKKDHFVFGMGDNSKSAENQLRLKFQIYKDLLWRVNYTNSIYVRPRDDAERCFKVYVGSGNNSLLIKGILRRRFWWQIVQKIDPQVNFVWSQLKISDFFKYQKKGEKIGRKKIRIFNTESDTMLQVCEDIPTLSIQSGEHTLMLGSDLEAWSAHLYKNKKHEQKLSDSTYQRRLHSLLRHKPMTYITSSFSMHLQNHLPCNYYLGNKKALFYSMRKYYSLQKKDPFTRIPLTFHISKGISDEQYDKFLIEYDKFTQKKKTDKDLRNIWIIKPGQFTNRGKGITVCATLDEIKSRLKGKEKNQNGTPRTFIVQKYIQKPFLYHKRKFDLRHYMMITCFNGQFKGYWYDEGYVRTTSTEYSVKNCKDLYTHLTNDAVQQNGADYGKYQKGNKVGYPQFSKYLSSKGGDFYGKVLPKMKELATDSIRATYSMLDPDHSNHNFELFGLDFMIDEEMNVNLIEVNTNPCLQTSCPLLSRIIISLIQNVFKLALDPLFPPPYDWPSQRKWNLGQNAIEQNKFTLVFDENEHGQALRELYRNGKTNDGQMGEIDEEEEEYLDDGEQWNEQEEKEKEKAK